MGMINKCDLMHGAKQNEEDQMQIERSRNSVAFDRNVKYNTINRENLNKVKCTKIISITREELAPAQLNITQTINLKLGFKTSLRRLLDVSWRKMFK